MASVVPRQIIALRTCVYTGCRYYELHVHSLQGCSQSDRDYGPRRRAAGNWGINHRRTISVVCIRPALEAANSTGSISSRTAMPGHASDWA